MIDKLHKDFHIPNKTLWCVSFDFGSCTRMFTSKLLADGLVSDLKSGKVVQ